MIRTIAALRELAGDWLITVGDVIRGGNTTFDSWADPVPLLGGMESDGPDLAKPLPIPNPQIVSAVSELPDSQLFRVAAVIIDSHRGGNALVAALRDRAAQFEVVERDADKPFLTPVHLDAHLTRSAQTRPE